MSGPENKETHDSLFKREAHLPKPDRSAIINTEGAAQLPARPPEVSPQIDLKRSPEAPDVAIDRKHMEELREKLGQVKVHEIEALAIKSEQERKTLITTIFLGQTPDPETISNFEALMKLSGNAALIQQVTSGGINQESLANHLLEYIHQQRRISSSAQEIAMLDSLEFQLIRMLQQVNPNIRLQQLQSQEDLSQDDGPGGAGPEKVEEEGGGPDGGSISSAEEFLETESEISYSPRSKKGKAKGRDRKSRFRKWMDRMMRAFRSQNLPARAQTQSTSQTRQRARDRRFVRTVRIFGRVIDEKTRLGIPGVKIISATLGTAETGDDGGYAFENVTYGSSYSLAPIKAGHSFLPLIVNDVALDYREHNFILER